MLTIFLKDERLKSLLTLV